MYKKTRRIKILYIDFHSTNDQYNVSEYEQSHIQLLFPCKNMHIKTSTSLKSYTEVEILKFLNKNLIQ